MKLPDDGQEVLVVDNKYSHQQLNGNSRAFAMPTSDE